MKMQPNSPGNKYQFLTSQIVWWLTLLFILMNVAMHQAEECDFVSEESPYRELVQECSEAARDFLAKLPRRKIKEDDLCTSYNTFKDCIYPLMENCTNAEESFYKDWSAIDALMECTCNNKTEECFKNFKCLRHESQSLFVDRCDVMYRFMRKERFLDECKLLDDALTCKAQIVGSRCGIEARDAKFELLTLQERASRKCRIQPNYDEYTGFMYSNNCSIHTINRIDKCLRRHIWHKELQFSDDNDLILTEPEDKIRRICKNSHQRYLKCIEPIQSQCPQGVENYFQMESKDRTYLLKMDFICSKEAESYIQNLTCLQDTVIQRSLLNCQPIFERFQGALKNVSPFLFYCDKSPAENSAQMYVHRGLESLLECYEQVFVDSCGEETASVMGKLMEIAFYDPYYLKFRHRPYCDAKLKTTTTVAPITFPSKPRKVYTKSPNRPRVQNMVSSVLAVQFQPVGMILSLCICMVFSWR